VFTLAPSGLLLFAAWFCEVTMNRVHHDAPSTK
jgi:hypothetical protein